MFGVHRHGVETVEFPDADSLLDFDCLAPGTQLLPVEVAVGEQWHVDLAPPVGVEVVNPVHQRLAVSNPLQFLLESVDLFEVLRCISTSSLPVVEDRLDLLFICVESVGRLVCHVGGPLSVCDKSGESVAIDQSLQFIINCGPWCVPKDDRVAFFPHSDSFVVREYDAPIGITCARCFGYGVIHLLLG